MSKAHQSHFAANARLKCAQGHLAKVIPMLEAEASCNDVAQQLFVIEKGTTNAKRALIHDHIDHCLDTGDGKAEEFKAISKYL